MLCLVRGRVRSISIKTGGRFCSFSIIPSDSTFALSFVFVSGMESELHHTDLGILVKKYI